MPAPVARATRCPNSRRDNGDDGEGKGGKDLTELTQGMMEGGAKGKTSGVLEGAVEKVDDMLNRGRERREPEEEPAPRRRPRPRRREDDE